MNDCLGAAKIVAEKGEIRSDSYDTILVVAHSQREIKVAAQFQAVINDALIRDPGLKTEIGVLLGDTRVVQRIVYSPIDTIDVDYDDVRIVRNAAFEGAKRALLAGSRKLLLVMERILEFEHSDLVGVLGVLESLYVPIQQRERNLGAGKKLDLLGVYTVSYEISKVVVNLAKIFEKGRYIARDIGTGDSERMTPINIQKYLEETFADTSIKLSVVSDVNALAADYPLFAAVNRCANNVERHRGRIIFLEYNPPKEVKKTLLFVGKGVTFDTGGADVKIGGSMVGMSRDKCGAASIAGFMKVIDGFKPEHIKVIAGLALVRNSVGSDAYLPDEIITSRAKVTLRVVNTDAEGRMAMSDVLCRMKEIALDAVDPHIFTIATLTGHAVLTSGFKCTIGIDNGPACKAGNALKVQKCGTEIGDPMDISTLRKEDFEFHKGKTEGEDIIQAKPGPSTKYPRGHQSPIAFMMLASGLDKHGSASEKPLKYTHYDISGISECDYPKPPESTFILALAQTYLNEE
ncbi:hypothetical protein FQA39_LY06613 [Lamprigera yunnana]|nr:hypothetical protein FQA39_LY06613 [Lamprigera yunnana]